MKGENKKRSAAHLCSACTSLVCMAQMGAMAAAGGATMATMSAATTSSVPFLTLAFQTVGLGFLLLFPPFYYQLALIVVLSFTILSSYLSFRYHKNFGPVGLTTISSFLLYSSIYLLISELLYWLAFVLMIISAFWSYKIGAKRVFQGHGITNVKMESKNPQ